MPVGVSVSLDLVSFLSVRVTDNHVLTVGGAVLAWGIIAPSLIKNGLAVGVSISDDFPLVSYQALSFKSPSDYIDNPSPRYWLLWPGVLMMLIYSVRILSCVGLIQSFDKFVS